MREIKSRRKRNGERKQGSKERLGMEKRRKRRRKRRRERGKEEEEKEGKKEGCKKTYDYKTAKHQTLEGKNSN